MTRYLNTWEANKYAFPQDADNKKGGLRTNLLLEFWSVAGYADVVTFYVNLRYRIVESTKIVFILSFRNLDAFFDDLRDKLTAEVVEKAQSELKIPFITANRIKRTQQRAFSL